MKIGSLPHKLTSLIFALACIWSFTSCHYFDEDLPACRLYVDFKYDYNLLSADAFHTQVDKVALYVFSEDGIFISTHTAEGAPLASDDFRMELPLPNGKYQFMAWAGARDSYHIAPLVPGRSSINDLQLKLKRAPLSRAATPTDYPVIDSELEPLWYGEITEVDFTGKIHQTQTINLIKDTNKIRFLFVHEGGASTQPSSPISLDDYIIEIREANGHLDHNNALLPDDTLSHQPYFLEASGNELVGELNTMRLMADRQMQLVITERASGEVIFTKNNLIDGLYRGRLQQYGYWSKQEYLDRQDQYVVYIYYSGAFINIRIMINDWTWYRQEEEL